MSPEYIVYFLLLAFLAEILGTVGGFGSSLFFVPIAAFFLEIHTVLGITALFHVGSNLSKIYFFRKGINKDLILKVGIPAVVFVILGAYLSKFISGEHIEFSLAIFLIMTSIFFLAFKKYSMKPTTSNSITGGVVSGFLAGLLGTGGAIRGLTLAAFKLPMQVFIATSAVIDLGIDASRSVVYVWNGYVKMNDLWLVLGLVLISFAGTYAGKRILHFLSENQFRSITLFLILITGIVSLVQFLS